MTTLAAMRTPIMLLIPFEGGDPLSPTPEMTRIADYAMTVRELLEAEGICMTNPDPLPPRATRIGAMTLWGKPPHPGPAGIWLMAYDEGEHVQEALRRVLADPPVVVARVLTGQEAMDYYQREVQRG